MNNELIERLANEHGLGKSVKDGNKKYFIQDVMTFEKIEAFAKAYTEATQAQEAKDQREYIERLEVALEEECGGRCNAEYNPCWARQLLASKPKDI
jgi:hypothetical protein